MVAHKTDTGYFLVLEQDELLIKTLTKFCQQKKIKSGLVTGLGAVKSATVGYYYLKQKRYKFRKIQRLMEIASLVGNISLKDGELFIHCHVVLCDSKLRALGGHLKEATVGGTCEVYLQGFTTPLEREQDEDTGLSLIK